MENTPTTTLFGLFRVHRHGSKASKESRIYSQIYCVVAQLIKYQLDQHIKSTYYKTIKERVQQKSIVPPKLMLMLGHFNIPGSQSIQMIFIIAFSFGINFNENRILLKKYTKIF